MTIQISPDQAMDAIAASRPDPETIDAAWTDERAELVLARIRPAAGITPRHVWRSGRRWVLIGVAASLIVTLGLFTQALLPIGTPGSPTMVQALDRLALAAPAMAPIPQGSYELTVTKSTTLIATASNSGISYAAAKSTRSTWMAADGWAWAHQSGDSPGYFLYPAVRGKDDLTNAPAEPKQMAAYLRTRVSGSTSVDEAMFVSVSDQLMDNPMAPTTRAAAIRMLADVAGISVTENTPDPAGRNATKISFIDPNHRPGQVQSIYLDPTDSQLLAKEDVVNGEAYPSVYTERRIVSALPADIVKVLGTDRVERSVRG